MSETDQKPLVLLGADHGGFAHKSALLPWLQELGYKTTDCGAFQLDPDDDYPVFAKAVASGVAASVARAASEQSDQRAIGVLVCRSGAGMVIAANRYEGVRAVGVTTREQAEHARAHNDANVIVLSGDWMDEAMMKDCIAAFLQTPFSGEERHRRRLAQIENKES